MIDTAPGSLPRTQVLATVRGVLARFHGGAVGWVVLAVSLAITGLGWAISGRYAERLATERFEFQVEEARLSIAGRMQEYEQVLRGAVGLFESTARVVTREEFRQYVAKLEVDRHYPGLQGIGFAQWIVPAAYDAHVRAVRAEGFLDYAIRPAGQREVYTSIVYLEPFAERNLRAFGFDMFSERVRRAAMERARDTGLPALSGRVTLVQETDRDVQHGFLMYLPVYRAGVPIESTADRRAALLGFVYSPFRVRDLMRGILPHGTPELDFAVYDGAGSDTGHLLYATTLSGDAAARERKPLYDATRTIEVAGHTWHVQFSSRESFESRVDSNQPMVIAAGGIAIDLLLFFIIGSLSGEHKRVLVRAIEMNREVREGEERLRVVIEQAPNAIVIADAQGRITLVNRQTEALFGHRREDLIGRPADMLMPDRLRDRPVKRVIFARSMLAGRAGASGVETAGRREDGSEVAVELALAPIDAADGRGVLASIVDITERRRAQQEIERSLQEKTTLLNEVHHRVKNNLQVISSLLSLQVSHATNPDARALLAESQSRVRTMALVHQLLYERQNFAGLQLGRYLERLVRLLTELHATGRRDLVVRVEGAGRDIELDPQQAIPCGLLVHELVTNALKHAFPAGRAGQVRVTLDESSTGEVIVGVADDGVGLPADFNFATAMSLGFQLLPLLAEQLGARLRRENRAGTCFALHFRRMSVRTGVPYADTLTMPPQAEPNGLAYSSNRETR